jgi:sec-independent protein translocase protein TatC
VTEDAATMSLLEHLEELRSRIIVAAVAVAVASVAGFFLSIPIIELLRAALPEGVDLIQLRVGEALAVRLRVALMIGIALAMPVILYEVWAFVTPGLTRPERRLVWPLLGLAVVLFALGLVVGYLVLPIAIAFLIGLSLPGVAPVLSLSEYIGFVTTLMLAFGLTFEFPVLLLLLARVGILSYRFLSTRRRWAILLIVLFAILITPGGDPVSSAILSLIMYGLFEGTLQLIRMMRR